MPRRNGKRRQRGERFAKIPLDLLEDASCATLPLSAFKVLTVLAAGYSGGNNGTLACTESWARKYGITGTDTVRLALKELERRGLIETTRRGMRMRQAPTLFALTWQPVNNRDGQPIDQPQPPSHRYVKWGEENYSWDEDKQAWMEISHPSGGGSVTPTTGVESSLYTPNGGVRRPFYTPTSGDTLRISTGGTDLRRDKVVKLMRELPHLPDNDISKITGAPIEFVSGVRQHQ